jgi:hypothetical protein
MNHGRPELRGVSSRLGRLEGGQGRFSIGGGHGVEGCGALNE